MLKHKVINLLGANIQQIAVPDSRRTMRRLIQDLGISEDPQDFSSGNKGIDVSDASSGDPCLTKVQFWRRKNQSTSDQTSKTFVSNQQGSSSNDSPDDVESSMSSGSNEKIRKERGDDEVESSMSSGSNGKRERRGECQ